MARHSGTHTSLAADLDVKSQHLLPTQSLRKHRDRQGLQMITVFSESSKVRLLAADSWKWKHENGNKVEKKMEKDTPLQKLPHAENIFECNETKVLYYINLLCSTRSLIL